MSAITFPCAECGEAAFEGEKITYRSFITGGEETEIDGDYLPGAGECNSCGRDFCKEHLRRGLCGECREEDYEGMPF